MEFLSTGVESQNEPVHEFLVFTAYSNLSGFPQALEIMENLENCPKKFHELKNHGI